jgi:hypothetical protein
MSVGFAQDLLSGVGRLPEMDLGRVLTAGKASESPPVVRSMSYSLPGGWAIAVLT